ncbi:hypothetical protein ACGVWS_07905 [Enterobacteriaceae bacterium LUAb1]
MNPQRVTRIHQMLATRQHDLNIAMEHVVADAGWWATPQAAKIS